MNRFRINESGVVHETIEEETVIINLVTGTYYSLRGAAVAVWDILGSLVSVNQIVAFVCERYEAEPADVMGDVQKFVDELRQEDLLVLEVTAGGADIAAYASFSAPRIPFEPLQFEKFTDMKHLLLLDPIHDVDDRAGWPVRKLETAQTD